MEDLFKPVIEALDAFDTKGVPQADFFKLKAQVMLSACVDYYTAALGAAAVNSKKSE